MASTDRVEALIRNFAEQLQAVIREQLSTEVTDAVQGALGGGTASRRGPGRGNASGAGTGARGTKRGAGGKRTPEQIEKLALQLLSYIEKNPEQRSEQIAEANKLTTGELVLPIRKLLADKKIKAKGKARGTTYTAVK